MRTQSFTNTRQDMQSFSVLKQTNNESDVTKSSIRTNPHPQPKKQKEKEKIRTKKKKNETIARKVTIID